MLDLSKNTENYRNLLIGFFNYARYRRSERPDKSISQIAEEYITNRISIARGLSEFYNYLQLVKRKNDSIMSAVKAEKGKTFFNDIKNILFDCRTISEHEPFCIVYKPCGDFQDGKFGCSIKGYWVERWSTGDSGDSFDGYIYIELEPNKYLKAAYYCQNAYDYEYQKVGL